MTIVLYHHRVNHHPLKKIPFLLPLFYYHWRISQLPYRTYCRDTSPDLKKLLVDTLSHWPNYLN